MRSRLAPLLPLVATQGEADRIAKIADPRPRIELLTVTTLTPPPIPELGSPA